jgi:murein DD-endopeptidase MepM/ murein hydrolase activator NlpD
LQWSTTMFDTAQAEIVELTRIQRKLEAAKVRQAALEKQVAVDRRAAAANLKTRKALEAQAAAEEARVGALLRERQAQQKAAAADVADDKARYAQLNQERASVERRIAIRIARAKAEALAKARAEARARAKAAAARKRAAARAEAEARRAEQRAKAARGAKQRARAARAARVAKQRAQVARKRATRGSSGRSSSAQRSSDSFSLPVSGPITSRYGMRLHPVLGYWKLHDGTDFRGGCGSVIRAPAAGRVAERYYNGGYGNRLMIDHGYERGKFVTTGYNHAIRYTVRVGQRVRKGQVIGFVGSTGYSTGCHLHLMVWLNGRVVNPMRWF